MSQAVEVDNFLIRRPREAEGPVCRLLLPGIEEERSELFVAIHDSPPNLSGAISFRQNPGALVSLRLRVVKPRRRKGIGTALLLRVIDEARRCGAKHIFSRVESNVDRSLVDFLLSQGFTRHSRLIAVEGDIENMLPAIRKTRERMDSHQKVPPEARIVDFPDAPRDQVVGLYAEHIVHNPDLQAALGRRSGWDERLAASPVMLVGDEVAGILLWSLEGSVAHVHARVAKPGFQGGWVNAVLLAEGMERAWAMGARRTRFEIPGNNRDTMKLSRRFRTEVLETVEQYRLDLKKEDS